MEDIEIDKESDEEASKKFWDNYLRRNLSIVVDLFVGQFKSTVTCPKCSRVSKTFDPFMSLSLPIPSYTLVDLQLYFIYSDNSLIPQKITLNLMSDSPSSEIAK